IEAGGGVVADGPPNDVFLREGRRLKDLGVWVPGDPPSPPRRRAPAGAEAIVARDLSYLYPRGEAPALEGVTAAVRRGGALALTGGEKRRLSVGTALATAPGALVLDEPTFGQDRRTFTELLALLAEFRDSGGAIAFASHDELFVEAFADERLRLERGRAA